ncbi:hypothetical protein [Arcicella rigui]|uniref:Uncharacterized protein n=1 Tax=Arcicella rigui TaxID=797020 RepID=A0ABU5Q821_9BACT|nr:hypothetical protein [Arcicella rigui]MEA5138979.1 hypothetical protein [Arcicella rigui]
MKKYIYILLATISIAFWYACTPPLEGVTLKLPESVKTSNIIVQFKPDNATAGDLPANISIKIAGKDSAKVVNIVGIKDFKVKQNVLALAASPDVTPSTNNPINFIVVAQADGYLKSTTPVTLTSTKDLNLVIELIKISAPSTGISVVQQPATVSSAGTTSAAITVSTPSTNTVPSQATVVIPAGVSVKDGAGSPVGGALNIVVTKADAAKTDVQIPLSEISKTVNDNNQPIQDFSVTPIVGVEVEITNDQNQKVKSFSGEITIKTEIPVGAVDPSTNQPLKVGDQMAITSFDEDTKVFKYEGPANITTNAAGKLEVSGTVNHLTQFFFASMKSLKVEVPNNATPEQIKAVIVKAAQDLSTPENPVTITKEQLAVFKTYSLSFGGSIGQYADEVFNISFEFTDNTNTDFSTSDRTNSLTTDKTLKNIVIRNVLGAVITTATNFTDTNITVDIPASPNFVNFIANLSCPAGQTTNADNIQVYSSAPGKEAYLYLGKARRDGDGITIKGTTTLLQRKGTYDFKFVVGSTNFYYKNKTVSSGADFTITSTMPDALCF